jgi:hypothetical protein
LPLPGVVNLNDQPVGVYFVKIQSDEGIYFEKLVKQ